MIARSKRGEINFSNRVWKILPFLIYLLFFYLLFWPGSSSRAESVSRIKRKNSGGTLVVQVPNDLYSLDSQLAITAVEKLIINNVQEGLLAYDPNGQIIPCLAAARPKPVAENKWLVLLRKGIFFHDGHEMDANDVAFTFNRLKDQDLNILSREAFKSLLSIRVIDKYQVELTTDGPCPNLDDLLTRSELFPLSSVSVKKYADRYGQVILIGTGAFKFQEWSKNKRIVLIRNGRYRDPPFLDRISFEFSKNSISRLRSLKSARSHIAFQIRPEEALGLKASNFIHLFYGPGRKISQIYLNCDAPPFNQKSNRLALAYGIDRAGLVQEVFKGFAMPADSCIPPWSWAHRKGYRPISYDPQQAKSQIEAYPEPLRFSMLVNKKAIFLRQAYYLQDCLAKIPILVDIVPVSKDELFDFVYGRKNRSQFQAALEDWNELRYGRDPAQFTAELYASFSSYNKVRLVDPILDRIFEEINQADDFSSQQELYFAAERRIMNSVSTIYLCFPYHIHAARSKVMNLSVNPLNEIDFKGVWLSK